MRDPDKSKVYAAEQQLRRVLDRQYDFPVIEIFGSQVVVPIERKFGDLDSVQRYVNLVWSELTRHGHVTGPAPLVRVRKGQTKAHYQSSKHEIAIPMEERWALREVVVLHELAHALAPIGVGHDVQFQTKFTLIVGHVMGDEAEFLLRALLHEQLAA